MTTTTTSHTDQMDQLATTTAAVVQQAMRVRDLDLTAAVALVADATGSTVEAVEAHLARFVLMGAA